MYVEEGIHMGMQETSVYACGREYVYMGVYICGKGWEDGICIRRCKRVCMCAEEGIYIGVHICRIGYTGVPKGMYVYGRVYVYGCACMWKRVCTYGHASVYVYGRV